MTYLNPPGATGGAWAEVEDDSRITYRVDPGGQTVHFVFFGPMELGVAMTAKVVQRCQGLLGEALTEMHRVERAEIVE